ncbi:hypothetical protein CC1G_11517 [Coprinopsis cinerea okayama7|uniref:SAP domain-containing protein n=1 Tax=Coprinopsis cinerea (strain Okayama-7 / 130 / ATCC MYA-4618 / FGSC 9003) TaxID=240176 RepID=A8NHB8_COPC7|nr:hypothetical protein CC1G_11517 [Coprinopsis cinerea okayama7\|eukprot:XP_001833732.2 hypothetical protein CC1G_11517 [Coprinopsis cinerea okayama7\
MAVKQECPTCRKTANEDHIRPNYVMEEAISAWNESRPYILGLIKREEERKAARQNAKNEEQTRKRKRRGSDSSDVQLVEDHHSQNRNGAGPSSPRTPKPIRGKGSPRRASVDLTIPSSDVEEDELTATDLNPKPDDIITCPLCNGKVKYGVLNTHMDRGCKDPPVKPPSKAAAAQWSMLMGNAANKQKGKQRKHSDDSDEDFPLPKASYATLKEKQIKEMLSEHGLPTHGDRSTLEQRHQRWVIIYNSNLDRSQANRKSKQMLRQELKKWEDAVSRRKKPSVDAKQHAKTHKSEFARLAAIARESSKRAKTIPSSVSPQPMSPGMDVDDSLRTPSPSPEDSKKDTIVID